MLHENFADIPMGPARTKIIKEYHEHIGKKDTIMMMILNKKRPVEIDHTCIPECYLTQAEYEDYKSQIQISDLHPSVVDSTFTICGMEIEFGEDIEDIDVLMAAKDIISFGYMPRHGYYLNDSLGRNLYSASMSNPHKQSAMYFHYNNKHKCEMAQHRLHIVGPKKECDLLYSRMASLDIVSFGYVYQTVITFDTHGKLYDPLKIYEATRGSTIIGGSDHMFRDGDVETKTFVYRGYAMTAHNSSNDGKTYIKFILKSRVEPDIVTRDLIDLLMETENQSYIHYRMVPQQEVILSEIQNPKFEDFTWSVCNGLGMLSRISKIREWVIYRMRMLGQSNFKFRPVHTSIVVKPLLEELFGPLSVHKNRVSPVYPISSEMRTEILEKLDGLVIPAKDGVAYNRHVYTFMSLLQRFYPEPIERILDILARYPQTEDYELNFSRLGPKLRYDKKPAAKNVYRGSDCWLDFGPLLCNGCLPSLSISRIAEYLSLDYGKSPKYLSGCYDMSRVFRDISDYHRVLAGMRAISRDVMDTSIEIIPINCLLVEEARERFICGTTLFEAHNHNLSDIKIYAIKNMNIPHGSFVYCKLGIPYMCSRYSAG